MTSPVDRERDRRSLKDLAKMAHELTPSPPSSAAPSGILRAAEARKDDSGIVDLAAAAQSDPYATARAQSTPLASHGLFDDDAPSQRPPMSAPATARVSAPVMPQQPAWRPRSRVPSIASPPR